MKNIVYIFMLLAIPFMSQAQLSVLSTYQYDLMQVNVAGVGSNYVNANLNYRAMWLGIKDAPQNYVLNASLGLGNKMAAGLKVNQYSAGLLAFTNVTGAYIYKAKLDDNNHLFMGLGATFQQIGFFANRAIVDDYDDVNLTAGDMQRANNFDCEAGAVWYGKKITLGFSANHLYNSNSNLGVSSFITKQNLNLHVSYLFKLKENVELTPMLLARYNVGQLPNPELLISSRFKKLVLLGVGYRYSSTLMANAGVDLKAFRFVYCFDYSLSKISKFFSTSHQVMLSFYLENKNKKVEKKKEMVE